MSSTQNDNFDSHLSDSIMSGNQMLVHLPGPPIWNSVLPSTMSSQLSDGHLTATRVSILIFSVKNPHVAHIDLDVIMFPTTK